MPSTPSSPSFTYVKNPALKCLHPTYPGNKMRGKVYYNDLPRKQPGFREMSRFMFAGNPQRREKKRDTFRPELREGSDFLRGDEDVLVWLGHASFYLRVGGVSLVFDPCFLSLPFVPRRVGIPCPIESIVGLDYILLSHAHRDHLDVPSMKRLTAVNPDVTFLTGLGVGTLLKRYPHREIQEAGWYQSYALSHEGWEISYLPAIHWNRRGLADFNLMLWGGFLLRTPTRTIYFSGDTAYGPHFQEIQAIADDIDLCIMPIGAYKPDFIMQSSHVNPEESVRAFGELQGNTFVPMHYGTYDLSNEPYSEPLETLRSLKASGALAGDLRVLAVGEVMGL